MRSLYEALEFRRLMAGTKNVFMVGNSMVDAIDYTGFMQMMSADGTAAQYGRQTGPGFTLEANLTLTPGINESGLDLTRPNVGNPWGTYDKAFAAVKWDDLALEPAGRRLLNDYYGVGQPWERNEAEVPVSLQFMDQLAANSPTSQVFIYSRPLRRTDLNDDLTPTGQSFDYASLWNTPYVDSGPKTNGALISRSFYQQLVTDLRSAQTTDAKLTSMPPARIIPVGEAYYNLDQMIKAGKFAGTGVGSITDLYHDASHPSYDLGAYVLALTFYSSFTGHDPRTMPAPSSYSHTGLLANPKVQTLLQQAVYDAMTDSDYAGMLTPLDNSTPVTPPPVDPPPVNPPPAAASISGTLWNDSDGDGVFDSNESATGARAVFLDTNQNGVLDAGEKSIMSDAAGKYTFGGLTAGTYAVSRVFPAGFHLSNSATKDVVVTVIAGQVATGINIGTTDKNTTPVTPPPPPPPPPPGNTASISGTLWNDTNANGVIDAGESLTGSRQVFIDANGNGKLDSGETSAMSDANSNFTFKNLAAGTYKLSRVFPAGFHLSNSALSYLSVVVANGQALVGVKIGTTDKPNKPAPSTASISGTLTGATAADQAALNSLPWTFFLDFNNDGIPGGAEPFTYSAADGTFKFSNLPAGAYAVDMLLNSGWKLVTPAAGSYPVNLAVGQSLTGENFVVTKA